MTPEPVTTGCWTLWFRSDLAREVASAYWRGPHGEIVASVPHITEYLQHHLSAEDHGFWPAPGGVGSIVPRDWQIDGMPEVRLDSAAGALRALPSMRELYLDEQCAFERVLCQLSGPRGARWWTGAFDPTVGQRAVVLVRRRRGLAPGAFRRFLHDTLGAALLSAGARELRTHAFLPGSRFSHWTPGVAHDDPPHRRYAAAIVVGANDRAHLDELLSSPAVRATRERQLAHCTAFHAYAVEKTLPFVLDGRQLARPGQV